VDIGAQGAAPAKLHVDLGHVDVGHVDFGHLDVFHIDVHVDITKPPEPDDKDAVQRYVAQINQFIADTDAQVVGFEEARRKLTNDLKALKDQVTKALAKEP
jgi:hypothetical protein